VDSRGLQPDGEDAYRFYFSIFIKTLGERAMPYASIKLIFRAAPHAGASPALVSATARQAVASLTQQNQRIEPVYDGSRGGDLYQWLVETANAAQPLIPLATLALTVAQLLKEVKNLSKSDMSTPRDQPPIVVVVTCGDATCTPPPDSDQALLERLLRETFPDQIEPDRLSIEVQVGAPPPPPSPFD
jgi:hypothetical protein